MKQRAMVERSAGGVVFRRVEGDFRFLLIRDPYQNWGLPKGHVESAETPVEAALREVSEETGLAAVAVVAPLPVIDWYFRDGRRLIHKFCDFFLLESRDGEPMPERDEGITACQWCSYEEALAMVTYDNAREVVRAAGRYLGIDGTASGPT